MFTLSAHIARDVGAPQQQTDFNVSFCATAARAEKGFTALARGGYRQDAMSRTDKSQAMFTAADVARFCQVDLKTIHNWAERGEIEHVRTPGRHLRFRSVDTLDFLRRYGYPIPTALVGEKPRVDVIDTDASLVTQVKRLLAKRFEVVGHDDFVDGLLAMGSLAPDAVLLDLDAPMIDGLHCVSRLRQHAHTKHVRIIACSRDLTQKPLALSGGATAFLDKAELSALRGMLDALLGRTRA